MLQSGSAPIIRTPHSYLRIEYSDVVLKAQLLFMPSSCASNEGIITQKKILENLRVTNGMRLNKARHYQRWHRPPNKWHLTKLRKIRPRNSGQECKDEKVNITEFRRT